MPILRIDMPKQWVKLIRDKKIPHKLLASKLHISQGIFSSYLYGNAKLTKYDFVNLFDILSSYCSEEENDTIPSIFKLPTEIVKRIVLIYCIKCKKPFEPYDDIPSVVCKECNSRLK